MCNGKKEYSKAHTAANLSLYLYKRMYGDSHQHHIGFCYNEVRRAHDGLDNPQKAAVYYTLAADTLEPLGQSNGMIYFNLGHAQLKLGETKNAEKSFRRAQHILSTRPEIQHSNLGDIKTQTAMILKSGDRHQEANSYFQAGLDMYDIADHLNYANAGKCFNEVRDYYQQEVNVNVHSLVLAGLYAVKFEEFGSHSAEDLLLTCKHHCARITNDETESVMTSFFEALRVTLVSFTLRVIKKWAARCLEIIQIINPDEPMPVYQFKTGDGTRFYL